MLKIDSHTHPFSQIRDSAAGLCNFAETAIARGFSGIVFNEHAPMGLPTGHCMKEDDLEHYLRWSEECKRKYAGKIEITIGLECDYLPENMDYLNRMLDRYKISYVSGSLHLHDRIWQKYVAGMEESARRTRFALRQLLDMANTGLFHTLNHLDFFRWNQESYHPEQFEDDFRTLFEAMVRHDIALEWNSSGLLKNFASAMPCEQVWQWSLDYPLRRVFGSDAHRAEMVGFQWEKYEQLMKTAEKGKRPYIRDDDNHLDSCQRQDSLPL